MITEFKDDYSFLSNFHPCKIEIAGLTFPSVENAYQAMKCENPDEYDKFVNISAAEAKKLGRKVKMREDFDSIKYNLMRQLLDLKFEDKNLLKQLLNTAPESIIEGNYWHDNYWGACYCDKCKDKIRHNHLGELLQRKRNLSATYSDPYTMYCGSIYHRDSQTLIEHPAFTYDESGYVLLKIGDADMCRAYMGQLVSSAEIFRTVHVFEFSDDISKAQVCELMNYCLLNTGYLRRVVTGNI